MNCCGELFVDVRIKSLSATFLLYGLGLLPDFPGKIAYLEPPSYIIFLPWSIVI